MRRFVTGGVFLLAAVAFLLPFVGERCVAGVQTRDLRSLSGIQLASGKQPVGAFGPSICTANPGETVHVTVPLFALESSDPQMLTIVGGAAAVLGIGLILLKGRAASAIAIVLGLGGAAALFFMKLGVDGDYPVAGQTVGVPGVNVEVTYGLGYWAALVLLVLAAVSGLAGLVMSRRPAPAAPSLPLPPSPA